MPAFHNDKAHVVVNRGGVYLAVSMSCLNTPVPGKIQVLASLKIFVFYVGRVC